MDGKTSDESVDEIEAQRMSKNSEQQSDTEDPGGDVPSHTMDTSCEESEDGEVGELPFMEELRKPSDHKPPVFLGPRRKSSLHTKLEQRKELYESTSSTSLEDEQTQKATLFSQNLRTQDLKMLDAAKYGKKRELISLLVNSRADINCRDNRNNTGLHLGAQYGHLAIVETFLDRGVYINTKGFDNNTALIQASFAGETAVVKVLLDWRRRPNIDHANTSGNTALMVAATNGYPDIVSLLLKCGADENKKNRKTGKTARQSVEGKRKGKDVVRMFDCFLNPEILNKELIKAASEGKARLVGGLITAGADMTTLAEDSKDTGFHISVKKGYESVARTFLDHQIDVNIRGDNEETALIMAIRKPKNFFTIKMLLDRGADKNRQAQNGDTALIEAARLDRMRAVCELLERNVDRTIKNKNDKTALDISREYSNSELAFLLDGTAEPDLKGTGERALTEATENGNTRIVSELLSRNVVASGKIKNSKGDNIYQIASRLPQTRQQEFENYIKEISKNKDTKPEEALTEIVMEAKLKSDKLIQIFLSQPLLYHDKSSVSDRIYDITNNFCLENIDIKKFGKNQNFYAKYDSKKKETLLEFVVNNGMLKEREEVLDAMLKVDMKRHKRNDSEAEHRIKKQVKKAVPSSEGLRDCLQSIGERFPWSSTKYWFVITMSFIIQVILGPGFYGLDFYTDVRFTLDMFSQAQRNFAQHVDACKPDFETEIDHVMSFCKTNLTEEVNM